MCLLSTAVVARDSSTASSSVLRGKAVGGAKLEISGVPDTNVTRRRAESGATAATLLPNPSPILQYRRSGDFGLQGRSQRRFSPAQSYHSRPLKMHLGFRSSDCLTRVHQKKRRIGDPRTPAISRRDVCLVPKCYKEARVSVRPSESCQRDSEHLGPQDPVTVVSPLTCYAHAW